MNSPLLSVVIPTYNCADVIGRAIDSLLAQTYQHLEIVVVNDGSTDDTSEVVQQRYPQVTYLEQENAGPCAARDTGVRAASGELIGLLDSDDEWAPAKAERQVQLLRERPEINIITTNGWQTAASLKFLAHPPHRERLWQVTAADMFSEQHPMGNSMMLPKKLFLEVGGYDSGQDFEVLLQTDDHDAGQEFFEDLGFLCRMIHRGYTVYCLDEPLYILHKRPQSRTAHSQPYKVLNGQLVSLSRITPDGSWQDNPGALSPRQHSALTAHYLAQATLLLLRLSHDEEVAREISARLHGLPYLPPGLRFLASLQRRSWPLFAGLLLHHQRLVGLRRLTGAWGLIGGIRRLRLLKRMEAELSVGAS